MINRFFLIGGGVAGTGTGLGVYYRVNSGDGKKPKKQDTANQTPDARSAAGSLHEVAGKPGAKGK